MIHGTHNVKLKLQVYEAGTYWYGIPCLSVDVTFLNTAWRTLQTLEDVNRSCLSGILRSLALEDGTDTSYRLDKYRSALRKIQRSKEVNCTAAEVLNNQTLKSFSGRCFRVVERSCCLLRHIRPSVSLHVSARIFVNFDNGDLRIYVDKFQIWLKYGKNIGHFTWRLQ